MGSPEFAVPSLIKLIENYNIVGVVTQPDRMAGRGKKLKAPPVKLAALEYQIPICQPVKLRKNPEAFEHLEKWKPDLIVVAAFGQILRKNILELAEFGCVNVHASLLPRWRGASPINAAILNGDDETGITIMKMDAGIDTGDILMQKPISIGEQNAGELSKTLSTVGAELLAKTLPAFFKGSIVPVIQNDEEATYAPMLKKEDGLLDMNKSAKQLSLQIRAYDPWPGSFIVHEGKSFKIHEAFAVDGISGTTGEKIAYANLPAIHTANGLLVLRTVQPAGKKPMAGDVFLRGARNWVQ